MSDCSNHKKDVAGITDMKVLAEMIGDLHYETLAEMLRHLSFKLFIDSEKDFDAGRSTLANRLRRASQQIESAQGHIEDAWLISKPFMNDKAQDHG